MIRIFGLILSLALVAGAAPLPPTPESVAILYNSASKESKALADTYATARGIPADNLIGLNLPETEEISRTDFDKQLRIPIIREYDRREWWTREKSPQGNLVPVRNKIHILVCMRGVPSRIAEESGGLPAKPEPKDYLNAGAAAVDSELSLLGIEGLPSKGPINNPYYKAEKSFPDSGLPMTLVGRIDGPTPTICERMIRDAIETEKTGLWGMSVIDIAKKFPDEPAGDPSLENIARLHRESGIPVMVDRFPDTLPLNFPLRDTAVYYGWYDWNVSGPFLNPAFQFKKGAVAVHLHSFSASQLRDPAKNWCAPFLARGAAATLGNVYEPLLALTHHFDIFQARLMAGYTLVEAAYMAAPAVSWQGVVLGDPLYRPFIHLDGSGEVTDADREYRAIRVANLRWKDDPKKLDNMLREGADKLKSGPMLEAIALMEVEQRKTAEAASDFLKAKIYYTSKPDRLRMDLEVAAIDRAAGSKESAIKLLRGARAVYLDIPEVTAASAWLNIIDPPPPPPAQPKK